MTGHSRLLLSLYCLQLLLRLQEGIRRVCLDSDREIPRDYCARRQLRPAWLEHVPVQGCANHQTDSDVRADVWL